MDVSAVPSLVGARAEAAVAAALVRAGRPVFASVFNAGGRVDLIYADEARLVRVQCKTGRARPDAVVFRTCSNTGNTPRAYDGEIDEFGVYRAKLNLVYLVPACGLPSRPCSLRLAPTRNQQVSGVRWARDYVLGSP